MTQCIVTNVVAVKNLFSTTTWRNWLPCIASKTLMLSQSLTLRVTGLKALGSSHIRELLNYCNCMSDCVNHFVYCNSSSCTNHKCLCTHSHDRNTDGFLVVSISLSSTEQRSKKLFTHAFDCVLSVVWTHLCHLVPAPSFDNMLFVKCKSTHIYPQDNRPFRKRIAK